jgi:hypothetical protein
VFDGLGQAVVTTEIVEEIENLLKDYRWMVKEIDRLERSLYGSVNSGKSWGVAQYGIEAAMPKGSGGISQVELTALDQREERIYKQIKRLSQKVEAIEQAAEHIEGEMHKVVFDCILEGMSYRAISDHLGVSRDKVRKMKIEIINQLSQNDHIRQVLKIK